MDLETALEVAKATEWTGNPRVNFMIAYKAAVKLAREVESLNERLESEKTLQPNSSRACELIRGTLMSQPFLDWYEGDFEDWLLGQPNAPGTEKIENDIKRLFSLEKLDKQTP